MLTLPDHIELSIPESFPIGYLRWRHRAERVAVVVTAPIMLPLCALIAAGIKIDSPGPAFFRQQRPGIGESTFVINKFRTMYAEQCNTGTGVTEQNDSRVTRLGHVLRQMHLDELPQLWNVLRGDMTFIGPRPEPMSNTALYERTVEGFGLRRAVLPGITGWAQVRLGYTATVDGARKKLEHDLFYIGNASLGMDASIIVQTLRETMLPKISW